LVTAADIVGTTLPAGAGPDSRSMLPVLLSATPEKHVRDYAVHHSAQGVFAIRQGPWKLVPDDRGSGGFSQPKVIDPSRAGGPPGQLYNLEADPSETKNVYADHPEVVERLSRLLKEIQERDV
jgi:arylsulfatase A-like enzyme